MSSPECSLIVLAVFRVSLGQLHLSLRNFAIGNQAQEMSAVVPTPVEDHYFARSGEVLQGPLHIHLRLFAIGGSRQCR